MRANLVNNTTDNLSKLNYSVLIEKQKDGYQATIWGMPDYKAMAPTREQALKNIHELVNARLQNIEIVAEEIELPLSQQPNSQHSWMKFSGMFKDDTMFNQVLEHIEEYRRELDTEMEKYYLQLDTEEESK
jgi:hypothetical protein